MLLKRTLKKQLYLMIAQNIERQRRGKSKKLQRLWLLEKKQKDLKLKDLKLKD